MSRRRLANPYETRPIKRDWPVMIVSILAAGATAALLYGLSIAIVVALVDDIGRRHGL